MEEGATSQTLSEPRHPYTGRLLAAYNGRGADGGTAGVLEERSRLGWACRFASLCDRATERCETTRPVLQGNGVDSAACHHPLPDSAAVAEPMVMEGVTRA